MGPVYFQVDIAHWGWTIAFFLWFVGIAGMLSVAYPWVRRAFLPPIILGSLALGLALVISHLSRWWNLPLVVWYMVREGTFGWGSWMFLGVVLLSFHFLLSLILVLAHARWATRYRFLAWAAPWGGNGGFLAVFALSGLLLTVYSGFLISQAAGIPLWNTPIIPALWLVSGALAALAILELAHLAGWWDGHLQGLEGRLGLAMDALKAFLFFAFLHVSLGVGSEGARIGAVEMLYGRYALLTWVGVIGLGILLPLTLGVYRQLRRVGRPLLALTALASLAGALFLRASILLAGAWEPL